jgi:hypothetical protein
MEQKESQLLLKSFMQEHFPYSEFKKIGMFTKEMRNNYQAQADVICKHLSLNTIYEYGKDEIRCHLSFAGGRPLHIDDNGELKTEPFVTVIKSIYD